MAVDADTQKSLEEVKKGKPRRFVMICKGAKIVSLIVFKKGTVEKYKKQAKEEGKGQFYHGVVSGQGIEITFNLLRSDGFENPPGKDLILKEFLKTEADMKFKAVYKIVDELPDVPDDEVAEGSAAAAKPTSQTDATIAPTVEAEPVKEQAPKSAASNPVAPKSAPAFQQQAADNVSRRDAIQQQFDQLQPTLAAALTAHPAEGDELNDLANEFRQSLVTWDLDVASEWLQKLVEALGELPDVAATAVTQATETQATVPQATVDPQQAEFNARVKEVLTIAVPLAKAGGERGLTLMPLLKTIQAQRAAGDFVGGLATITHISQLLQESSYGSTVADPATEKLGDATALFSTRLKALLPQIKQAAGTPLGDAAKLKASEAAGFARKNEFVQANLALDQLDVTLRSPPHNPASSVESRAPEATAENDRLAPKLEATQDESSDDTSQFREMYLGLMSTLPNDLGDLRKLNADAAGSVEKIVAAAKDHEANADFKEAFKHLEKAAEAIAAELSVARSATALDVIPAGIVAKMVAALDQAHDCWDATLAVARAHMKPFQTKLQIDFPQAAVGLSNIIDSYEQDLTADLRSGQAMANAEGFLAAVRATLEKVQSLRAEAASDAVLADLEQFGVPVQSAFAQAFDEVEALLHS